jgi:signal transduction histidine kinase
MGEREPINILLVDDDSGKLLSYEAILSELGEHLITARSGTEALRCLLDHEIAVILLDVQMPEMDGFALAQLIREHPRYQDTPIIFISAVLLTHHDQLKGYEHGAVDYLTVPFIPELLRAKVRVFVEHYRCRQALVQAQRDAQRAQHFAMLGHLAAGVSHEIRNPMAALALHIDLLDEELHDRAPESAAMVAELLAEIKTQLARVDDLLQDYLSLVRVAAIERTPQDLGEALQAWAGEWQQLAQSQGVTLRLEGIHNLGILALHPSTFRRALLNLVQNALDAMPQGGTLTIRGQRTATDVQLQVQDTGSGIAAATLAQIFEPLYTTKPGGTGLGLYIVQEIIAAHGGQVTVESVVGQGTTFTVTLPLEASPQQSSHDESPREAASASEGTISHASEHAEKTLAVAGGHAMAPQTALQVLVVDDNPGILSALTRLLQRDGHMVQTATNGQEALALLHERGFDLILCDLLMPALDGQTLYGLLQRQLPAFCQRMIFLTGDTLSPDSRRFVEQCGQPWIPKPCGIAEVRTAMAQILPALVQDAPEEPGERVPVEKLPLTGPLLEGVDPRSPLQARPPPEEVHHQASHVREYRDQ